MTTFGSVCSGIEAASVAWNPLGWQALWLAEIEPFPCELLRLRYPDVPNLGDMTTIAPRILSGEIPTPDILCGGTPCQAFSLAGKRQSLDDARGNLTLTFCEIANAIDSVRLESGRPPAVIFWENVPGVLRTKDNAFGCFLAELAGSDVPLEVEAGKWPSAGVVSGPKRQVAWRVLDAQYFGVPQRRRRVFVVASSRADFAPPKVLFECPSVSGDPETSGDPKEDTSSDSPKSLGVVDSRGGAIERLAIDETVPTILANCGTKQWLGNQEAFAGKHYIYERKVYDMSHPCDVIRTSEQVPTLKARMGTGGNQVPLVIDKQ